MFRPGLTSPGARSILCIKFHTTGELVRQAERKYTTSTLTPDLGNANVGRRFDQPSRRRLPFCAHSPPRLCIFPGKGDHARNHAAKRARARAARAQHHQLRHRKRLCQHPSGLRRFAHHGGRPGRRRGDHRGLRRAEPEHRHPERAHHPRHGARGPARKRPGPPRSAGPRGRGRLEPAHEHRRAPAGRADHRRGAGQRLRDPRAAAGRAGHARRGRRPGGPRDRGEPARGHRLCAGLLPADGRSRGHDRRHRRRRGRGARLRHPQRLRDDGAHHGRGLHALGHDGGLPCGEPGELPGGLRRRGVRHGRVRRDRPGQDGGARRGQRDLPHPAHRRGLQPHPRRTSGACTL